MDLDGTPCVCSPNEKLLTRGCLTNLHALETGSDTCIYACDYYVQVLSIKKPEQPEDPRR